jgi:hypothetical protein
MSDYICPVCRATLAVDLTPAALKPAVLKPAELSPAELTPAHVNGLVLVALPPVEPAPIQPPVTQPVATGIAIVPFNLPYADVAKGSYNGSAGSYGPDLIAALPGIKTRGGGVIVCLSRSRSKDANGLSVAATEKEYATYDWPRLSPYIADGTIAGFMIGDDITASEWGSKPPYLDRYDAIAGIVKSHHPLAVPMIRARAGQLSGYSWRNKVVAWAQYSFRKGDVNQFLGENLAAASRLGIITLFGLNVLDGGDGSSKILGTYADKSAYQMTAAEILKYGKVLLPESPIFPTWRWTGNFEMSVPAEALAGIKGFDARADVKAAFQELRRLGDSLPRVGLHQGSFSIPSAA